MGRRFRGGSRVAVRPDGGGRARSAGDGHNVTGLLMPTCSRVTMPVVGRDADAAPRSHGPPRDGVAVEDGVWEDHRLEAEGGDRGPQRQVGDGEAHEQAGVRTL